MVSLGISELEYSPNQGDKGVGSILILR